MALADMIDALYGGAASAQIIMVQDNLDGRGAFIAVWDEEKMGMPKPTIDEVESAFEKLPV